MPRPAGVRNQDFEEKRLALVTAASSFLLSDDVEAPSFRQIAIAVDTSEPTLRHYFQDRSGVIIAVFEQLHELAASMRAVAAVVGPSIEESVTDYLDLMSQYRENSLYIRAHRFGIRESMIDEKARRAYLENLVMPGVEAVANRLFKSPGWSGPLHAARQAAMMLMGSSIFMVLHQELLNGKKYAPMDVDAYFERMKIWMKPGLAEHPDPSVQN